MEVRYEDVLRFKEILSISSEIETEVVCRVNASSKQCLAKRTYVK